MSLIGMKSYSAYLDILANRDHCANERVVDLLRAAGGHDEPARCRLHEQNSTWRQGSVEVQASKGTFVDSICGAVDRGAALQVPVHSCMLHDSGEAVQRRMCSHPELQAHRGLLLRLHQQPVTQRRHLRNTMGVRRLKISCLAISPCSAKWHRAQCNVPRFRVGQ